MAINGMRIRNSLSLSPIAQPTVNVVAGDVYYDSTANMVEYYNGSSWLSLASLTGTETLINKTLTSPAISAATLTGATTLTDATTIVNATTATKVLAFNLSGMTAAKTLTLSSSQSTTQTLTIPNITASDTLATLGLTQTFTAATTFNASGTALTVSNTAAIGTLTLTNALAVSSGGTGQLSALTQYGVVYASTTGAMATTAAGTLGYVLTSNGTSAPTFQLSTASLTGLGIRAGKTAIGSGVTTIAVTFSSTLGTTSYAVTANLLNTTDTNPQFQPIDITVQSATGFTASFNAPTATANYVLSWVAILNN